MLKSTVLPIPCHWRGCLPRSAVPCFCQFLRVSVRFCLLSCLAWVPHDAENVNRNVRAARLCRVYRGQKQHTSLYRVKFFHDARYWGLKRGFCAQHTAAALRRRRRTPVVHISYFTEIIKEPICFITLSIPPTPVFPPPRCRCLLSSEYRQPAIRWHTLSPESA